MAVINYAGPDRPINDRFEGKERSVEWDNADGIHRGYQIAATGQLVGICIQRSAAKLAADAAVNSALGATDAQIATFRQSIVDLATIVKNNSGTVAQQATAQRALMVKLARVAAGTLSD